MMERSGDIAGVAHTLNIQGAHRAGAGRRRRRPATAGAEPAPGRPGGHAGLRHRLGVPARGPSPPRRRRRRRLGSCRRRGGGAVPGARRSARSASPAKSAQSRCRHDAVLTTTPEEDDMTQLLGDATINELEGGLAGSLVRPGDGDYEEARHIWNRAIDKHPAMIVRAASTDDVVRTVRFAASEGLPVAVRGGAHSVAGFSTCDDGIVVDLSAMTTVEVDADGTPSGGRRRDEVGRVRRRHAGPRPGHHRRAGLDHGTGRVHAGRRHRPSRSGLRPGVRQPARRRGGDRRRLGGAGQPGRRRRALLGASGAEAATSAS